ALHRPAGGEGLHDAGDVPVRQRRDARQVHGRGGVLAMALYLSAAVSGLALGLLYGLVGFAIVMLYKATGVANFAQGALGTLGAFLCLRFMRNFHMPLGYAIAL